MHTTVALGQLYSLKKTQRAGWKRHGIPMPESVAEHSYYTGILALLLCEEHMDVSKLLTMLLVHDWAESNPDIGDITPHDGIAAAEKYEREKAAMQNICQALPNGERYLHLWLEFEEAKTPEAVLARQIDKLEMALQAIEYEKNITSTYRNFKQAQGNIYSMRHC